MRSTCALLVAAILMNVPVWAEAPKGESAKPETPVSDAAAPRPTARPAKAEADGKQAAAKDGKCDEHGVSKKLCARCNPKLEPVFKAKGDWCEEHKRPESQCVLCHPDLEKKGVK